MYGAEEILQLYSEFIKMSCGGLVQQPAYLETDQ